MPSISLGFLADLHAERLANSTWPNADPELPGEQAFVDTARTLSQQKLVQAALIDIIQQTDEEPLIRQLAVYVGLMGTDTAHKVALINAVYQDEESLDISPSIAWLTGEEYTQAMALLAEQTSESALHVLAERCIARGQEQVYLSSFMDQGVPRYTGGLFDQLYARSSAPLLHHALYQRFIDAQAEPDTALPIARALLHCQNSEALDWLCSTEGIIADAAATLSIIGGPQQTQGFKCCIDFEKPLATDIVEAMADNLEYYGNPWSFEILYQALFVKPKEPALMARFHRLMLNFFDTEHAALFSGILLLTETEQQKPKYPQRLYQFWNEQKNFVNQTLRLERYYRNEPFNLAQLFQNYYESTEQYYPLADFIFYIALWIGQRLAFDPQAFYTTQCPQLTNIQSQIEKAKLLPGCWYRWGQRLMP